MKAKYILGLILLVASTFARADCIYNGQSYPNGTRLGSLVCTDQGWK